MSEEKSKAVLEQLLNDTRSDMENFNQLFITLASKVGTISPDQEKQRWIMDVYLDKLYELESKLVRLFEEVGISFDRSYINQVVESARILAFTTHDSMITARVTRIKENQDIILEYVESKFSELRRKLKIDKKISLENIKPIEYVSVERKRYVTSREELEKAKKNIQDNPEDVMNYLRSAIDLSIKEKFGFKKIPKMIRFIDDADKLGFPLPSYSLIYTYFSEGSGRIHAGKIHTLFEAKEAIRVVSNFIDQLEIIEVTQQQIDEFKGKSKSVQ